MRISIHSPADTDTFPESWRDFLVKSELADAFSAAGHSIAYAEADLNVHIWGSMDGMLRTDQKHVVWVVSHPTAWIDFLCQNQRVTKHIAHVYCASESLTSITESYGLPSSTLVCPAPSRPELQPVVPEFSVAFVGNASPEKGRDTLRKVFERHSSMVAGGGWGDIAQGTYIPWKDIAPTVNKSRLYVHTSYPDMRSWGIMPDNVLDVAANTRALVLHDSVRAAEDLPLSGPTFTCEEELLELCSSLLKDESTRLELEQAQRADAKKFAGFQKAAETMTA